MATATEAATALSLQVVERSNEVEVVIAGAIDESSVLRLPDARGRRVVINAEGVDRINSMGVRAWIAMMDELDRQTRDIVFRRLPPVLVTQASMISIFLGNARIESFLSPWFCPRCENTLEQVHGFGDDIPRSIRCPKCGDHMELDWDRDAYLAFREG